MLIGEIGFKPSDCSVSDTIFSEFSQEDTVVNGIEGFTEVQEEHSTGAALVHILINITDPEWLSMHNRGVALLLLMACSRVLDQSLHTAEILSSLPLILHKCSGVPICASKDNDVKTMRVRCSQQAISNLWTCSNFIATLENTT